MKSKKFEKKLGLNKETVAHLNTDTLTRIKAGVFTVRYTCVGYCDTIQTCEVKTVCGACWSMMPTICATDCAACD